MKNGGEMKEQVTRISAEYKICSIRYTEQSSRWYSCGERSEYLFSFELESQKVVDTNLKIELDFIGKEFINLIIKQVHTAALR